jgi:hypothetical protein
MKLKNIKNYGELQMYWRYQIKQVLPQNRRAIFWRNDAANVTIGENDILHYWGAQTDVAKSKISFIKLLQDQIVKLSYLHLIYYTSIRVKETFG